MTEDAVVKTLGNPTERLLVQADTREYTACRGAGATRILSYRLENHGWFRGFGLKSGWHEFLVCLDKDGHVVQTNHAIFTVWRQEQRDPSAGALLASLGFKPGCGSGTWRSGVCQAVRSR